MGACPSAQATVAEVDLGAFAHNLRVLRQQVSPGCRLMAVLKADAYGHGATVLAATAVAQGITHLAVACCQEGIALRQAGISGTIVVLGPLWPEEAEAVVAYRLTPVLASLADGAALNQAAGRQRRRCPVHVNIDTGMGRLGLVPQVLPTFLAQLRTWRWLRLEGLMTHLATADAPDPQGVQQQLATFKRVRALFAAQGWQPPLVHVANSAALFRYPESHGTLVRPGIALYGICPFEAPAAAALRPVLRWKTRLARVQDMPPGSGISYGHTFVTRRPSRIGTLPVGYADGLCRRLSNLGQVLVRGRRVPLVGQICMDMAMVDLTDVPQAQAGDEVVLIGRQGNEEITAGELAARCGTIPYETLCAIGPRVPRRYLPLPAVEEASP